MKNYIQMSMAYVPVKGVNVKTFLKYHQEVHSKNQVGLMKIHLMVHKSVGYKSEYI